MVSGLDDHEAGFIDGFVIPSKRDRFRGFLSDHKRRQKFLSELYHFRDLDGTCALPLDLRPATVDGITKQLMAFGAPGHCFVISTDSEIDQKSKELRTMLERLATDSDHGTILSSIPGKLAIYNGSGPQDTHLLRR